MPSHNVTDPPKSDAQIAYERGVLAGKDGKSATDNPYLNTHNYLANSWWRGCVEGGSVMS